jgi:hypothetical protein
MPSPDSIAIAGPIAEIGRSRKRPLRAIFPVPIISFLLPSVDRFLEMRYQVIPFFKKYVILGKGIVCVVKRQ